MGIVMDKMQQPIGVFDSGVGGISVLRELAAWMPNEDYIFFGDSKNAPYGTKTLKEVQRLTCADAQYLVEKGVKALVVACNTATSAAIEILRRTYPHMPVIGIEPALKPAVISIKNARVLVLATPMTLREEKFHRLMVKYRNEADIIPLPCPGLVEFVERGELGSPALTLFLKNLFAAFEEEPVDCAVLGCTHYPLVKQRIQEVLGAHVDLFDGGVGTARETHRRLKECGLLNPSEKSGHIILENSLQSEELLQLSRFLLEYSECEYKYKEKQIIY